MCPLLQFEPVSLENDLALLELISPVKLKENIIPACLHKDREYLGIKYYCSTTTDTIIFSRTKRLGDWMGYN